MLDWWNLQQNIISQRSLQKYHIYSIHDCSNNSVDISKINPLCYFIAKIIVPLIANSISYWTLINSLRLLPKMANDWKVQGFWRWKWLSGSKRACDLFDNLHGGWCPKCWEKFVDCLFPDHHHFISCIILCLCTSQFSLRVLTWKIILYHELSMEKWNIKHIKWNHCWCLECFTKALVMVLAGHAMHACIHGF